VTTINLANPEILESDEICMCESVPLAHLVHSIEDHHKAATLVNIERRCSVCDLIWGEVAYSEHERCALVGEDGERSYAYCVIHAYNQATSEDVIVEYEVLDYA